jgi:hypothetical protein
MTDVPAVVANVWLGNRQAIERVIRRNDDGSAYLYPVYDRVPLAGDRWTHAEFYTADTGDAIRDIRAFWPYHSDSPAPSWVASNDLGFATAISAEFTCPIVDIPTPPELPADLDDLEVHAR